MRSFAAFSSTGQKQVERRDRCRAETDTLYIHWVLDHPARFRFCK